jgi:predicted ribonuclease YlaK
MYDKHALFDDQLVIDSTLTRRERKNLRKQGVISPQSSKRPARGLELKFIKPKTYNQEEIFDFYDQGKHLLIHGYAGTGKSFLACYMGIREVMDVQNTYNRIVLIRSTVATREIGHLPGKKEDKIAEYEAPYVDIFSKLFGRGDAYSVLKHGKQVEFECTSFLRGITIDNAIVIVDEIQNMTFHELDSILTRLGDNAKIILCGDFRQSDLKYKDERQGLGEMMKILKTMNDDIATVEMQIEDIVRSGFVKAYIIARTHHQG